MNHVSQGPFTAASENLKWILWTLKKKVWTQAKKTDKQQ